MVVFVEGLEDHLPDVRAGACAALSVLEVSGMCVVGGDWVGEGWRGQLACGTTTNVEKGGVPEADINSLYSGADGCSGEPVTGLLWLLSHPF